MTIHIPQIVEDRFMIMGIPAQYHRCDTVMQIIFADTAASGRHTGSQPLNSCVRHKPDGDHIPSHLGPALTLFIKKTLIPLYPPGFKFCYDHLLSPFVT